MTLITEKDMTPLFSIVSENDKRMAYMDALLDVCILLEQELTIEQQVRILDLFKKRTTKND